MRKTSEKKPFITADMLYILTALALLSLSFRPAHMSNGLTYGFYTGLSTAAVCLVPFLLRRTGIMTLPLTFVMVLETALFLHGYGVLSGSYDRYVWYDFMTHVISSMAVCLCVFYALIAVSQNDKRTRMGKDGVLLFTMLIMTAFGIYWETAEFVLDMLTGLHMQYGPFDTIADMVSNVIGAAIIGVYARHFIAHHSDYDIVEGFEMSGRLARFISQERN